MAKGLFNIDTAAHQGVKENVVAGILGALVQKVSVTDCFTCCWRRSGLSRASAAW